ncbi:MAG: nucleotidyltransferase domain-containing protein [Parasporobacterium sp.]|nr:nucleotidyltransferase domain-containing protein [Parasporobacterium sp.]
MTVNGIKKLVETEQYDFLRTNPHLGENIILLGLGGSYSYGTNNEDSDIDIRGIALNTKEEILLGRPFEQVVDNTTDTTVYSFSKIIKLLTDANPNVLEMLFLEPEHYLKLSQIGQELLDKRNMFLSKRVFYTFGGYARTQLSRLDNKTMRNLDQSGQEVHILRSIQNAAQTYPEKYFAYPDDAIRLYIDDAVQEDMKTEIFMDINLKHYPLRDYKCMWSEMHNIVKDYGKIGKRAKSALRRNINKHALHLVRMLTSGTQILTDGTLNTYRKDDHDFLMDIRNGKYMDENNQMTDEFFGIVDDLERKMEEAASHSLLPDKPNYKEIDDFVCGVNERIVRGEI